MTRKASLPDGYFLSPRVPVWQIKSAVAEAFGLPTAALLRSTRAWRFSHPRQVAMYLTRELTPLSYPNIARLYGKDDHTTAMHACWQVEKRMANDKELCLKVKEIHGFLLFGTSERNRILEAA